MIEVSTDFFNEAASMPPDMSAAVGGVFALIMGFSLLMIILGLVMWAIQIVAFWKIFEKAGEPGWKSIIPVYSMYVQYKLTWKTSMFWVQVILAFAGPFFASLAGLLPQAGMVLSTVSALISLAILVIMILGYNKLAKSFGYGAGFTVGLTLLYPVFVLILGLGSSTYKGADL